MYGDFPGLALSLLENLSLLVAVSLLLGPLVPLSFHNGKVGVFGIIPCFIYLYSVYFKMDKSYIIKA